MGAAAKRVERVLGDRLREARLLGDISARQLDQLAELRAGHTSAIESGRRPNIEARTAQALAGVLGLSLDWLLSGVGTAPTAASVRRAVEAKKTP